MIIYLASIFTMVQDLIALALLWTIFVQ